MIELVVLRFIDMAAVQRLAQVVEQFNLGRFRNPNEPREVGMFPTREPLRDVAGARASGVDELRAKSGIAIEARTVADSANHRA
jgi:hypothetical protein